MLAIAREMIYSITYITEVQIANVTQGRTCVAIPIITVSAAIAIAVIVASSVA